MVRTDEQKVLQAICQKKCSNICAKLFDFTIDYTVDASKSFIKEVWTDLKANPKTNKVSEQWVKDEIERMKIEMRGAPTSNDHQDIAEMFQSEAQLFALQSIESTFIHNWIFKKMDLAARCAQNHWVPVMVDSQLPADRIELADMLTKVQKQFWYMNAEGKLQPGRGTIEGMMAKLQGAKVDSATLASQKELDPLIVRNQACAKEQMKTNKATFEALKDVSEMEGEVKLLMDQMSGRHAATAAALNDKQISYVDKLVALNALIGQGESKDLREKIQKFLPATLLQLQTLESTPPMSYVHGDLTVAAKGRYKLQDFKPSNKEVMDITAINGTQMIKGAQMDMENCLKDVHKTKASIRAKTEELSNLADKTGYQHGVILDLLSEFKKTLSEQEAELRQVRSALRTVSRAVQTNERQVAADKAAAAAALDTTKEAAATMAKAGAAKFKVPVWETLQEGGIDLPSFSSNFTSAKMKEEMHSQSTTKSQSTSVGVTTPWVSGSVDASKSSSQGTAQGTSEVKESATSFHFQATTVSVYNPALDKMLDILGLDDYYIPGQAPGSLWSSEGMQAQYVLDAIVVCQKEAVYCESSETKAAVQEASSSQTQSIGGSVSGGFCGFGASVSHSVSSGSESSSSARQANATAKDDKMENPNLHIKFLLYKPMPMAPLNARVNKQDVKLSSAHITSSRYWDITQPLEQYRACKRARTRK